MDTELSMLIATAASLGFIHTLFGPDHYIPFVAMSKSRNWSISRTIVITSLCGLGHVGSSIAIGFAGIYLGTNLMKIEIFESTRGNIAAWLLAGFGLAYFIYGIRKAMKNKPHSHMHLHSDGTLHEHKHVHEADHTHVHQSEKSKSITPWILFVIFLFGPCEPLIPLLMYPSFEIGLHSTILIASVFSIVTIGTMLLMVILPLYGISFIRFNKLERYTHALAGASVAFCGIGILFLGF